MALQISDLQVSGNAASATGKANASSVKPGKTVSFADSTKEAQAVLLSKLATIVGRAQGNNNNWVGPIVASYTTDDAQLEPDELLLHLASLVEGWDPPSSAQLTDELAKRICASVNTTSK